MSHYVFFEVTLMRATVWVPAALFALSISAMDVKGQDAKAYRGAIVLLKTHENAFGVWRVSPFDQRKIHDADITLGYARLTSFGSNIQSVLINGSDDWRHSYVISKKEFQIKEFDIDKKKNLIKAKLQATDQRVGTELNLSFRSIADFKETFDALFYRFGDDISGYEAAQRKRIIETQIEPKFNTVGITESQKLDLIADIEKISSISGKVEISARDDGAYIGIPMFDGASYNTVRVNKNQRLATTIEKLLRVARDHIAKVQPRGSLLAGYILYWPVAFRNFVSEKVDSRNQIELIVNRDDLTIYSKGDLSAFDLVKRSVLRVDGERYSLTTWEPIQ